MKKLFKDLQVGDIIYTNINSKGYDITELKITGIENVTTEWHTYKEWAYGEEEEYAVKCNKNILIFNKIKVSEQPPFNVIDKLEIDLGIDPSSKIIPDGNKDIVWRGHWFCSNKEALVNYYKECLEREHEKIEKKLNELDIEITEYNKDKAKVYGYENS